MFDPIMLHPLITHPLYRPGGGTGGRGGSWGADDEMGAFLTPLTRRSISENVAPAFQETREQDGRAGAGPATLGNRRRRVFL